MFISDIAFSAAVKQIQDARGSRRSYARMEESKVGFADAISTELASYIAARESFYLVLDILEQKDYYGRVEQAIVFRLSAWDANCPQHIPRLVPVEWVEQECAALEQRIRYLETTQARAGVAFEKAIAAL